MSIDRIPGPQPPQFSMNADLATPESIATMACLAKALLDTQIPVTVREFGYSTDDGDTISFRTDKFGDEPDAAEPLTLSISNPSDGDLISFTVHPDIILEPLILTDDYGKIVSTADRFLHLAGDDDSLETSIMRDLRNIGHRLQSRGTVLEDEGDSGMFVRWMLNADEIKSRVRQHSSGGLRTQEYSSPVGDRYELFIVDNSGVDGLDVEEYDLPRFCAQVDDIKEGIVYCYQIDANGTERLVIRAVDKEFDVREFDETDYQFEEVLDVAGVNKPTKPGVEFMLDILATALAEETDERLPSQE